MRTIQLTIDEDLVKTVDRKHREGYEKHPVSPEEFTIPETDQVWGDG